MTPVAIELRPYQRESIQSIREGWRRRVRRPLIQLPTGTGKTIVFSSIISAAAMKDRRAIVLAHRDELISQAADKLISVAPELAMSIGRVQGKDDEVGAQIVVASVQTLARPNRLARLNAAGDFDIVIVDEAHHAAADSYRRVLEGLGAFREDGPLTIGVTATAQRADRRDLGEVWQEIVYSRDMLSMILEGYLCNLRGIQVRLAGFDADALTVRRGDFVDAEAGEALSAAEAPEYAVRAWQRHAAGRKTIVFTPTIALAQEMATRFRQAGIAAESVSGVSLDERRDILDRFHRGEVTVVTNAQVLTEGYDEPGVECIVIARPTRSQPMYVQMVGRGTRTAPGKDDCLILDLVGASDRMDLTTLPRLFGMGEDDGGDGGDAGLGNDDADLIELMQTGGIAAVAQEQIRRGRITARQVELFNRADLHWIRVRDGLWTLNAGDFTVCLEARADEWDVVAYPKQRGQRAERISEGLEQGYAMGAAEDWVRRQPGFAVHLVSRSAEWRGRRPSRRQLQTAGKLQIAVTPTMTAGEVSDLISARIAQRRRAREARR